MSRFAILFLLIIIKCLWSLCSIEEVGVPQKPTVEEEGNQFSSFPFSFLLILET